MSAAPVPFAERVEYARAVLAGQLAAEIPTWMADQAHAAHRDGVGMLRAMHRALPTWTARAGDISDPADLERTALFVAAWMAFDWRCPHVRAMTGPAPMIANLGAGRTYCVDKCVRTRFAPLNLDRCDLCGEVVESNQFVEFAVQVGGVIFAGNAGDCCAERAGATS